MENKNIRELKLEDLLMDMQILLREQTDLYQNGRALHWSVTVMIAVFSLMIGLFIGSL